MVAGITRLSAYLRKHRLSQSEFGRACNLRRQLISKYLLGQGNPSLANAVAIERATKGAVAAKSWLARSDGRSEN